MRYYFIGIGGTGAKCVEAMTHLCAAGLMPDRDELRAFFIDPDEGNAMRDRAVQTLNAYRMCTPLAGTGCDAFKTPITTPEDIKSDLGCNWSPQIPGRPRLEDVFDRAGFSAERRNRTVGSLMDVLYSEDELALRLEKGFRGRPAIGAAIFAHRMRATDEFWKLIYQTIDNEKGAHEVRIIVAGSIFGGTGAAGIPTIGRLLRDKYAKEKKVRIASILILPFFSYTPPTTIRELFAQSENFLLNTQMALLYYADQNYGKYFRQIYPIGDDTLAAVKDFSIGGGTQNNDPHYIELYGALAAIRFFSPDGNGAAEGEESTRNVALVARNAKDRIAWADLPGMPDVHRRIGRFARFAYAYTRLFHPVLQDIKGNPSRAYGAPWYVQMIERPGVVISRDEIWGRLEALKTYCERFLEWAHAVHVARKGLGVEVLSAGIIEQTDPRKVGQLVLPAEERRKGDLKRIWEQVCEAKSDGSNGNPDIGSFVRSLYNACGMEADSDGRD